MIALGVGRVEAFPAHQLRAPGNVSVLAVNEEIGIEELAGDRDVFDHLAPVERGGGGGAEDVFVVAKMAIIHLETAAVEMPEVRGEIDAGGIDQRLLGEVEAGGHGEEFAADRADLRVE